MATNLGSTDGGVWNTANMKPEANDQTDALWAQNMADNTAFLAYQPKQALVMGPAAVFHDTTNKPLQIVGSSSFILDKNYGTLVGTFSADIPYGGLTTEHYTVKYDGTTISTDSDVDDIEVPFRVPISHFPAGSQGKPIPVTISMWGTVSGNSNTELQLRGLTAWMEI